jgi:iron-sulfur cluster assembly protein
MQPVALTESARAQLKNLLERQGRDDLALRVYVSPGGCSGFSYGMSLEDQPGDDDYVFGYGENLRVVVDPFSAQYLEGAQVDYVDALMGGGFNVQNPQAVTTCACGSSFKTAAEAGAAKPCH